MDRGGVQLGAILAGRYRVERIIGQGGMGIVVQATHLHLGQPVAMKFLLPEVWLPDCRPLGRDGLLRRRDNGASAYTACIGWRLLARLRHLGEPSESQLVGRSPESREPVASAVTSALRSCAAQGQSLTLITASTRAA